MSGWQDEPTYVPRPGGCRRKAAIGLLTIAAVVLLIRAALRAAT